MKNILRRVEVLRGIVWVKTDFKKLETGDRFRMFDPPLQEGDDWEPVKWEKDVVFVATSDAYEKEWPEDKWNDQGLRWTIDAVKESEYESIS